MKYENEALRERRNALPAHQFSSFIPNLPNRPMTFVRLWNRSSKNILTGFEISKKAEFCLLQVRLSAPTNLIPGPV